MRARREQSRGLKYAIVTPARNEEAFIGKTIQSVVSQSVLPQKWVVVSDGSTDRTDEIVDSCRREHDFIELVRVGGCGEAPSFGSKVRAFNAGYARLADVEYDFIGNLDADVSFDPHYFERLLEDFERTPTLGIAGGIVLELVSEEFKPKTTSTNSVAGAAMMFRRKCFEDVGGFIPIKGGGEDSAAGIMARMRGWRTRTLPELGVLHHRRILTGGKNAVATAYNFGVMNYMLGYHPLFLLAFCLKRAIWRPPVLGSMCTLWGYLRASWEKRERPVSAEFIEFLRMEQMRRLKARLWGREDGP